MYRNWWTLSRDAIPKALQEQGYDNFNVIRYFEAEFSKAESSSTGQLEWDGEQVDAPISNLMGYSNYQKAKREGTVSVPVYYNIFPHALYNNMESTCWASSPDDANAEITMTFEKGELEIEKFTLKTIYDPVNTAY
jgi:hypothetical protein